MSDSTDTVDLLNAVANGKTPSPSSGSDTLDLLNAAADGKPRDTMPSKAAATVAPAEDYSYNPSLLPIKRVAPGTGMFSIGSHSYDIVVPGMLKDVYNVAQQAREAQQTPGNMERLNRAARAAVPYALGMGDVGTEAARAVPQAAGVVGKDIAAVGNMAPAETAMTKSQLAGAADNAYTRMEESGVRISPQSFSDFVDRLPGTLKGYSSKLPSSLSQTNGILKDLQTTAAKDEPLSFLDLDSMRQSINSGLGGPDGKFLRSIKRGLDDYMNKLNADDLVSAHPVEGEEATGAAPEGFSDWSDWRSLSDSQIKDTRDALTQARSLWQRKAKMEPIQKMVDVAERKQDPGRYLSQRLKAFTNTKAFDQYSPDEQQMIQDAANGGKWEVLGNWLAPSHGATGLFKILLEGGTGEMIGSHFGAPGVGAITGATAGPAIGMAAKGMADSERRAAVQQLQDTIALGHRPYSLLDRYRMARAQMRAAAPPPVVPSSPAFPPAFSINGFHGSPVPNLTAASASPLSRQFDNATSQFGAFVAPEEAGAVRYAGSSGTVYRAAIGLQKPYEMPWREFNYFQSPNKSVSGETLPGEKWEGRAEELKMEAQALRARLQATGHDGVVVRNPKGHVLEVASFKDIPLSAP